MVVERDRVDLSSLSSCRCCFHCSYRLRRAVVVVAATVASFQVVVEAVNSSSYYSRSIQDTDEIDSLRDRSGYCIAAVGIDHLK